MTRIAHRAEITAREHCAFGESWGNHWRRLLLDQQQCRLFRGKCTQIWNSPSSVHLSQQWSDSSTNNHKYGWIWPLHSSVLLVLPTNSPKHSIFKLLSYLLQSKPRAIGKDRHEAAICGCHRVHVQASPGRHDGHLEQDSLAVRRIQKSGLFSRGVTTVVY
ncbi:hypothetical protein IE81DRAFT_220336 [Ceraceosorus guamensis]|uniref:Uncharacterized protein n=1 Tax=Ceraceosorus guamensis TaxID=1522189 RepID=A0A316VW05_9BASI|nr:hypothetical protein IE81DRAFT_220336 [Ceraceosorus guamensis]PWN40481.1 hypothetical protein IE81DRAFT_220336 [Ceraceosorus guamensis]